MDTSPRVQRVSMICSSSFDNFGLDILPPTRVVFSITHVVELSRILFRSQIPHAPRSLSVKPAFGQRPAKPHFGKLLADPPPPVNRGPPEASPARLAGSIGSGHHRPLSLAALRLQPEIHCARRRYKSSSSKQK